MKLSDEQKKRIDDEERQRLAEEQYRVQVRRELLNQTGDTAVPVATVTPVAAKSKSFRSVIIVVVGAVVVLCPGSLVFSSRRQPGDDSASSPSTSDGQSKGAEKTGKPSPILPQ